MMMLLLLMMMIIITQSGTVTYRKVCVNGECLTDEDDGKHVPGGGEHARRAEHREVDDLPSSPVTETTESLVQLHDETSSLL